MFGYVSFYQPDLKFSQYWTYRSYYCGLCRELRERYFIPGELTLTYDMTFVLMVLTGLYEPKTQKGTTRCPVHPVKKHTVRKNEITGYIADMNILLAYYKCQDDWEDEKNAGALAMRLVLEPAVAGLKKKYPKKCEVILAGLRELAEIERSGVMDLDRAAGTSGKILAEIFAWKEDIFEAPLRRMGFYLGKFVYLMDAFDDIEKDQKNGSYNPLKDLYREADFEEEVRRLLVMMMTPVCRSFECLPILRYADIIRNVLYAGVWVKYDRVCRDRKERQEKKHAGSI